MQSRILFMYGRHTPSHSTPRGLILQLGERLTISDYTVKVQHLNRIKDKLGQESDPGRCDRNSWRRHHPVGRVVTQ
jgi:hypothetical protein